MTPRVVALVPMRHTSERVPGKIGTIKLKPGDTLLMLGAPHFMRAHRNSPDFYLVSEIAGTEAPRYERAWIAIAILIGMVLCASFGLYPIAVAAPIAAGLLIVTRCISGRIARRSVDWSILIVIGAGLGVATAMDKTGAASWIAHLVVSATGDLGPWAALAVVYLVALLLAEMLHHNAAVAMMFPVAVAAAAHVGADPRPFIMAVAVAGCCAFASPVTYQTHLIVYGPGGYRFTDFVRVGLPLDILCAAIAIVAIPWIWEF